MKRNRRKVTTIDTEAVRKAWCAASNEYVVFHPDGSIEYLNPPKKPLSWKVNLAISILAVLLFIPFFFFSIGVAVFIVGGAVSIVGAIFVH